MCRHSLWVQVLSSAIWARIAQARLRHGAKVEFMYNEGDGHHGGVGQMEICGAGACAGQDVVKGTRKSDHEWTIHSVDGKSEIVAGDWVLIKNAKQGGYLGICGPGACRGQDVVHSTRQDHWQLLGDLSNGGTVNIKRKDMQSDGLAGCIGICGAGSCHGQDVVHGDCVVGVGIKWQIKYGSDAEYCARVQKVHGKWQYVGSGNTGQEMTLEEGVQRTSGWERSSEWSASITTAIEMSAALDFGFGSGSATASVSAEVGTSWSRSYSSSWTTDSSASLTLSWQHDGLSLWQFALDTEDMCGATTVVNIKEYAWTARRDFKPRCLPGYCNSRDDPLGRCCTCTNSVAELDEPKCPKPVCPADVGVQLVIGATVTVSPSADIDGGSQTEVGCQTLNSDFIGSIVLSCSEGGTLSADGQGCRRRQDSSLSSPPPSASPLPSPEQSPSKQCVCSGGKAAVGDLCPATGATFCVSCHAGYERNQITNDCVPSASSPSPPESIGLAAKSTACWCLLVLVGSMSCSLGVGTPDF